MYHIIGSLCLFRKLIRTYDAKLKIEVAAVTSTAAVIADLKGVSELTNHMGPSANLPCPFCKVCHFFILNDYIASRGAIIYASRWKTVILGYKWITH